MARKDRYDPKYGQTSLKVDIVKKDLLKKRGFVLQDLFNLAMDVALDVDGLDEIGILKQIEEVDEDIRMLKTKRAMLVQELDKAKQQERDRIKNKDYEQLKRNYHDKLMFDETDDDLLNKVALTLDMSKTQVKNKIIEECKDL